MTFKEKIVLVDCPRDAIQGINEFISTEKKAKHINTLIDSDLFEWIDFGSFVSPKAVPQMADTEAVLDLIETNSKTKLLAIIANERGADIGAKLEKIDFLGYPFSISEEFQRKNTNTSIEESFEKLKKITDTVSTANKETVVYISMGFGNPYGDTWSEQLVIDWMAKIAELGVKEFSLSDTTSEATPEIIKSVFQNTSKALPHLRIGVHLHSEKSQALAKIHAAFEGGCTKFDGALMGYGGCPFAKNDLVGNIPSEDLLHYFKRGSIEQINSLKESFKSMIN